MIQTVDTHPSLIGCLGFEGVTNPMRFFRWLIRVLVATAFLAASAFCVFGFLATHEPPESPVLRVLYAVIGVACVVAAGLSTIVNWDLKQGTARLAASSSPCSVGLVGR